MADMAPARVFVQDPCFCFSLPATVTVAHMWESPKLRGPSIDL